MTGGLNDDAITIRHLYDKLVGVETHLTIYGAALQDIRNVLADHETRLRVVEPTGTTAERHAVTLVDHEGRLRAIDKWRYALPITALLSIGSLVLGGMALMGK